MSIKEPMTCHNAVPLPYELAGLPVIEAEPWLQIDENPFSLLEGPAFDRSGNLYVTCPVKGEVFKIAQDKEISVVYHNENVRVNGMAIHRDGRLFIACLSGELLIMNPDHNKAPENNKASAVRPMFDRMPLVLNDLVFDDKGNIFVTDFKGLYSDPSGGVYYLDETGEVISPVIRNLAGPNGISLGPDKRTLWVSETKANTVLRVNLAEDGKTPDFMGGVTCVYRSVGSAGPDSNKVDIMGNLYQCIMGQGRIVVLDPSGIPIANILIKGRENGKHLFSSNIAFRPGTNEGYVTTAGEGGAWIFRFSGLANGLSLFSHSL